MKPVILFDLGQTLVDYFTRAEFPPLVRAGLAAASASLGLEAPCDERVRAEDGECPDGGVRPLRDRLMRIFDVTDEDALDRAVAVFTDCLIAPGRTYDDTLPTLEALRRRGHRMGIVSNMPWGTPSEPWAADIEQRGLAAYMDHILFCHDVGRRKPDRRIFDEAVCRFGCAPEETVFVGDRPDWDIAGAQRAGLRAVLLDRHNEHPDTPRIATLDALLDTL